MIYLLDTVSIIRYFSGKGKIGKIASQIFDNFDLSIDEFAISAISLMEILYLSEKNRIDIDLKKTINKINTTNGYRIIDLNSEIILKATEINFYELHDRMILATAKWMDIPLISSDSKFKDVDGINVIWD